MASLWTPHMVTDLKFKWPWPVPEIIDARDIIVVPMSFERALHENRCLFFAADPLSPSGPLMPVCGCERAENPKRKPYCAAHLAAEGRPRP